MPTALLNIAASARSAQAADGTILTTEFLESCRELLPIVGACCMPLLPDKCNGLQSAHTSLCSS